MAEPDAADPATPDRPADVASDDVATIEDLEPAADPSAKPHGGRGPIPSGVAGAVVFVLVVAVIAAIGFAQRGVPTSPAAAAPGPPRIAVIDGDGNLVIADASGAITRIADPANVAFGFPAWSPDGRSIASVTAEASAASISVFDVSHLGASAAGESRPTTIYRSADRPPFYLYWTPDSRAVSFLATEGDGIVLLVAAADGSSALDGKGNGALIYRGNPLYFDWIDPARLALHVGSGPDAFLGEVDRGGTPAAAALATPGDFRSPSISADGRYIAFARAADGAGSGADPGTLVVSGRDGSNAPTVPIFGIAAAVFSPVDPGVATIAATEAGGRDLAFPIGPLRVVDAATGASRTILDGLVLAFFWSPDGRSIAAIRLQPAGGTTAAASPSPTATPDTVPMLVFVDVASGKVTGQRQIRPGARFVSDFLPYFDQYALSHTLWAPDSSTILMPLVGTDGQTTLAAIPRDGSEPTLTIDGVAGFWTR